VPRLTTERREMSEEAELLGVVKRMPLGDTRPFQWRRQGVLYYPVFTSRETAEAFVRAAGYPGAYDVAIGLRGEELRTESLPLTEMLQDIRPLDRDEIPLDHKVVRDPVYGQGGPDDFVTWRELS
jgi:hypothetical protein